MSFYVGFTVICDGIAVFEDEQAMKAWLNHETEIDRFFDKDAAKHEGSEHWDDCLGRRKQFTPEQVERMLGKNFERQLYEQEEPATPGIVWKYF